MAREKATVTIDRDKLERAQALIRVRTMSETIDVALDRLIRGEELRRDVGGNSRQPQTGNELELADVPLDLDLDDDDVDYEALYGERGDPAPRRGEVWFADVPGKRRPVLVLSRDPMGRILHSVICAPITSRRRGLATELILGAEAGLAQESVANFDNTFLLARSRLVRRLGRASRTTMDAACAALATATGCRG